MDKFVVAENNTYDQNAYIITAFSAYEAAEKWLEDYFLTIHQKVGFIQHSPIEIDSYFVGDVYCKEVNFEPHKAVKIYVARFGNHREDL